MSTVSDKNFPTPTSSPEANTKLLQRFKKLGIVCFVFFLIKGLFWLLVPMALYLFSTQ